MFNSVAHPVGCDWFPPRTACEAARGGREASPRLVAGFCDVVCLGCFKRRLWLGSAGSCGLWQFGMDIWLFGGSISRKALHPSRERCGVVRGVVCSEQRAAERNAALDCGAALCGQRGIASSVFGDQRAASHPLEYEGRASHR